MLFFHLRDHGNDKFTPESTEMIRRDAGHHRQAALPFAAKPKKINTIDLCRR
jgi:hypothetical protein